jgi:adenosylcobinamide-phosphate synthase
MDNCLVILGAILIDVALGWPSLLFRLLGHPVTWLGKIINLLDANLNKSSYSDNTRKFNGFIILLICLILILIIFITIQKILAYIPFGIFIAMIFTWPLIAINSMHKHVKDILEDFKKNKIQYIRKSVSKVVGRNTLKMNKTNLVRASIESLGENTSDGIIAPIFLGLIFGLPGIALYKTINTLDSMIGYKNKKYKDFGWASAKIDDLVNVIPSRITGFFYAVISKKFLFTMAIMIKDAKKHVSPNAGYPEAALAGALNVSLCGPRVYNNSTRHDPWLNETGLPPSVKDLKKALKMYKNIIILIISSIILFLTFKSIIL